MLFILLQIADAYRRILSFHDRLSSKKNMKKIFAAAAWLMLAAASIFAQDSDEPGKHELSVWGGFAPAVRTLQPTGGRTWDAHYGIAALRYSHRWKTSSWVHIKCTADAVPFAVLNYPDTIATPTGRTPKRETRYAFGGSPFGLQANLRPNKKLQPFIGMSLS